MWSIYSCFQWYKNIKNRPKGARVIVENKVALFSGHGVYIAPFGRQNVYAIDELVVCNFHTSLVRH